jgi:hypothetical protein
MITSTSTVLEDYEYLNNLALTGQTDLLNSESENIIKKYQSGQGFKDAVLEAREKNKTINSNLPETEMLQEAQTGDASLGERIAQEQGISVPEGTKSGSKITEPVVPSKMYTEQEIPLKIMGVDIGETYTIKPEKTLIEKGLEGLDNKLKTYSPHLLDTEIAERSSDTGDAKIGEMDDFEAYKKGMIKSKQDLYGYDKEMLEGKGSVGKFFDNAGGDKLRAFDYDRELKNRIKERTKAMGMKGPGEYDYIFYDDERYNPEKGLQILGSNQDELLKREEIVKKAEMMNPGDPNAGEKALNEYLMTQQTKLDTLDKKDKVERFPTLQNPTNIKELEDGTIQVGALPAVPLKEDIKKKVIEEAEGSELVDKGGLADLKKATKGKGWELLMHMGIGIATEDNVAKGIKSGLKNAMEFEKAFGDKASDFQIVELGDGRLVRVNKSTGEVMDTGEKGKGSDEPASIKALRIKAEALDIPFEQLVEFDLTSGDKTRNERIESMYSKIMNSRILAGLGTDENMRKEILNEATSVIDLIDSGGKDAFENLLPNQGA